MLVKDLGRKFGSGVDLVNHEVKSAKNRGSYEYQHHKIGGREKLAKDKLVGHLFFSYSADLSNVTLRYLHGSELGEFFDDWLKKYPDPYGQRYRKSIPYGFVERNGTVLMTIREGELIYPELAVAGG